MRFNNYFVELYYLHSIMNYIFLYLIITSVFFLTFEGVGQKISQEELLVTFYKKGKNKPIKITYPENGFVVDHSNKNYKSDLIDKIVIDGRYEGNITLLVIRSQEYIEDKPIDTVFKITIDKSKNKSKTVYIGNSVEFSDPYKIVINKGDVLFREYDYFIYH